ncbi:hypothetical protein FPHYL_13563 [Fusarium phyllophilum]|uniref:Uncharacterized protein n=1 Tax=Fusarium phyllophilum TaxID=47803 RepID=A0A8H5IAV5_9HYPO|nr:hypothetical protein FPHYL_13563 [Fusarium phyllophilum]
METTIPTLKANPQSLSPSERSSALAQCHAAILQIEASEVLDSVHNAESTEKFSSKSLQRLKTLLSSFIKGVASERIKDLEDSDPELVIVYGLCMTTREIDRMKDELWNEVKRQARLVASHLARYLALNAQIAHTINSSSNTKFQKAFENLQKDHSLFNAIHAIIIDQQGYFHYIAPQIPQLQHLAKLAITGRVALYLPELELDGRLRITTGWDPDFLDGLFVCPTGIMTDGFVAYSNRARVAQYLGEYISSAIDTSQTRAMELPNSPITQPT